MPVGSLEGVERGTGSRNNDGKVPVDLLPLQVLLPEQPGVLWFDHCLDEIARFQNGDDSALARALDHTCTEPETYGLDRYEPAARVFAFGAKKYARWNWCKGMSWSVCLGSAIRHIVYGLQRGETHDPESGLEHRGHIQCNLIMILAYMRNYREGDDRPSTVLGWGDQHGR